MKSDQLKKARSSLSRVMSSQKIIKDEKRQSKKKIHQKEQEKVTADVEAFLKAGGEIEILDSGEDLPSRKAMSGDF